MIASGKQNKQQECFPRFFLPDRGIALRPHLEEERREEASDRGVRGERRRAS